MKTIIRGLPVWVVLLFMQLVPGYGQGSWNPAGADLSFPRTLLDSAAVPAVRQTLSTPEITGLYHSLYLNAMGIISADDSNDYARLTRALMAKEAAFTVLMGRKYDNGAIVPMTTAERDTMTRKCLWLLENMNIHVGYQPGWVFYQEWQFRSKELIGYLVAWDLLRGAGISPATLQRSRDSLLLFTANLYHRATATYTIGVFPIKFFNFQFDNHSIMTASALGLAAIVLNDNSSADPDFQPQNWINAGMWNLDNTLWMQGGTYPRVSEPDTLAGYAEGPWYFTYAFQNAFPFIRAMGNFLPDGLSPFTFNQTTRQIPNPWYDRRYDYLYDWMNRIRMPDGSFPAIHDSYLGMGTSITALSGKSGFNVPNPRFSPDDPYLRAQYIATAVAPGTMTDSLFQPLPEAGSLVFRSSWDTAAICMHLIAKHGIALSGAKSHHQGDASGFTLFAYGQMLAPDPGYPGAALSSLTNGAANHNLVLVNGSGPLPPNGEFVNTGTNTAFIEHYFSTPFLDYGEVRTSYGGATITRKILFINHQYFTITDFLTSTSVNDYTFQLHGNGLAGALPQDATGAFYPGFSNATCTYQRDSVHLLGMIQNEGTPASFTTATDSMAIGNGFRHYTKTMAIRTADSLLFVSTLFPWVKTPPVIVRVASGASQVASGVGDGARHAIFFAQRTNSQATYPPSATGLATPLTGNGNLNLYRTDSAGAFASAFLQHGDSIVYGRQPVIRADHKTDVAYEQLADGIYAGYISDAGIVAFASPHPLRAVSGAVSGIAYDPARKLCTVTFASGCNFRLETANGLAEKPGEPAFQITASPNPSHDGLFQVTIHSKAGCRATLLLADQAGRTLTAQPLALKAGETQWKANLSGYPPGAYRFILSTATGSRNITLVKIQH
ncbi:MAG: heparinase II/III family protein [Bacteroidota bacterium]